MRYTIISLLAVMFVLVPVASFAGDIDSPGPPSAGSGMYTIGDIYNYLIDGTEPGISDVFREPAAGPGATMKSTKDIYDNTKAKFDSCDATPDKVLDGVTFFRTDPANWGPRAGTMTNNGPGGTTTPGTADQAIAAGYWSSANAVKGDADLNAANIKKDVDIFGKVGTYPFAGVEKTGQTKCYNNTEEIDCPSEGEDFYGQDGNFQKGVTWPNPRFTDNTDGTVTDNLTGLMWAQNADATGTETWADALTYCNDLSLGPGGSEYTDWRLPNVNELSSLIDWAYYNPALSNDAGTAQWTSVEGSSFSGVRSKHYWSSTTYAANTADAWVVNLNYGVVRHFPKTNSYYVWPVRGGQ